MTNMINLEYRDRPRLQPCDSDWVQPNGAVETGMSHAKSAKVAKEVGAMLKVINAPTG